MINFIIIIIIIIVISAWLFFVNKEINIKYKFIIIKKYLYFAKIIIKFTFGLTSKLGLIYILVIAH